jgi:hypothetical protein
MCPYAQLCKSIYSYVRVCLPKKTQAKKWPTFLSNLRNAGKVMQKEEDGKDSIVASLRFCRGGDY